MTDTAAPFPRRFVPVPRATKRADGWTTDRQYAFIAALARLPSVTAAARSVGMRSASAYRLRMAPGAWDFIDAWDEALAIGRQNARDTALDRALTGALVPVRSYGRIVGEERRYEERLLLAVLNSGRGRPAPRSPRPPRPRPETAAEKRAALHREIANFQFDERVRAAARPFIERMEAAAAPRAGPRVRGL